MHALATESGTRTRRQALAAWSQRTGMLSLAGKIRGLLRQDLRILAYHRVLDSVDPDRFEFDLELISASADAFRRQMNMLKRDFEPMRFDQVIEYMDAGRRLPARAVLVTFDDGYDDNYRVAYPILRELGVPAMFFVSTGHIESGMPYAYDWLVHMICKTEATELVVPEAAVAWNLPTGLQARRQCAASFLLALKRCDALVQEAIIESLAHRWEMPVAVHPECRPMSWAQLGEMRDGGMEIGSHGVHHRMLAKLPPQLMDREINESKSALESMLGEPARVISYPVGGYEAFDDDVAMVARNAGFRMACSYITGTNRMVAAAFFSLRRLHVERSVDAAWFQGMLELPEIFSYRTNMLIG